MSVAPSSIASSFMCDHSTSANEYMILLTSARSKTFTLSRILSCNALVYPTLMPFPMLFPGEPGFLNPFYLLAKDYKPVRFCGIGP